MVWNLLFSLQKIMIQPGSELLATSVKTLFFFFTTIGSTDTGPTVGQIWYRGKFKPAFKVYKAEMALAATLLPSGRVRSVMARTTLGLARAGSFTSSETCMHKKTINHYFSALVCQFKRIMLLKAQRHQVMVI